LPSPGFEGRMSNLYQCHSTDYASRARRPISVLYEDVASGSMGYSSNPSIGSRLVPCGRTDMTKLIVVFSNFSKAPKNA